MITWRGERDYMENFQPGQPGWPGCHVIAKLIFVAFYRRAEISANRASPAHVIRPSDGGHKNAPNRASISLMTLY